MVRPKSFIVSVFTPWARAIWPLLPVARMAQPTSVPKNQYRMQITTRAKRPPTMMAWGILCRVMMVFCPKSGTFARPIIRIFMEYKASWVRMPERMAGIRSLVCSSPVMAPAAMPASVAKNSVSKGSIPFVIRIALTAPPVQRLPSTVRSA
ncbi:hypothetical protein SDC9_198595 [bioreactor metagenome]|uniref:Uncharacterized protein n=1 Tax=bioreactor metagenome TaxID=1076179 RepID=A0A645II42_9ZZZZ